MRTKRSNPSVAISIRAYRLSRQTAVVLATLCGLLWTAGAGVSHAQSICPEKVPETSKDRRAQAKVWFDKAEAADSAGDAVAAIKAYQCSLRMVPHAFTTFNLARLAEKTGDLELAVESYGSYLKLAPEAQDKTEVESKMKALSERIAASREPAADPSLKAQPIPAAEPAPIEPAPMPRKARRHTNEPPLATEGGDGSNRRLVGWVVAGAGVAALVGGVVLNASARGSMDKCRDLAQTNALDAARSECDGAKPKAYASYVLMPLGVLAAAGGLFLALTAGGEGSGKEVALVPLEGGGFVSGRWRF